MANVAENKDLFSVEEVKASFEKGFDPSMVSIGINGKIIACNKAGRFPKDLKSKKNPKKVSQLADDPILKLKVEDGIKKAIGTLPLSNVLRSIGHDPNTEFECKSLIGKHLETIAGDFGVQIS